MLFFFLFAVAVGSRAYIRMFCNATRWMREVWLWKHPNIPYSWVERATLVVGLIWPRERTAEQPDVCPISDSDERARLLFRIFFVLDRQLRELGFGDDVDGYEGLQRRSGFAPIYFANEETAGRNSFLFWGIVWQDLTWGKHVAPATCFIDFFLLRFWGHERLGKRMFSFFLSFCVRVWTEGRLKFLRTFLFLPTRPAEYEGIK